MNIEFYQTKEFYNAVACATALIIFLFLFFYGNIFKKKPVPEADWQMSSDFITLKALIQCSENGDHLQHYTDQADEFFNNYFRLEQDNKELIRYYSRLLEALSVRKQQLKLTA